MGKADAWLWQGPHVTGLKPALGILHLEADRLLNPAQWERLACITAVGVSLRNARMSESLYAPREPVFPSRISGRFRSAKWWIMGIALGIYYLTPWLRWDRGANLPDQAVLLDIANRRFFFFMIDIWPHEFYFVAGLLIMAGLGLFLFTSTAGRVWCGYACPQTIWTDLFILVERWIEGDRNARIRLHRQAWNAAKMGKRVTKWTVWLLIALATGGAWIFYFTDAPTLLQDLLTLSAHPIAWITLFTLTATTFTLGGFMREQVCVYMCPWPRIQAAMMDESTLTIAYRDWRGEPRGKLQKSDDSVNERQGDCINCYACVNVCPMGIDIRNGQQLACITCGLCIDACDEVMDKIGKPRGLIGYLALTDETSERAGTPKTSAWRHVLRPRNVLYTALWAGTGILLLVALLMRDTIDVNVTPVRNPTFVTLSDGSIRNSYDIRLRNMQGDARWFEISLQPEQGLQLSIEGEKQGRILVPANHTQTLRLHLQAPRDSVLAQSVRSDIAITIAAEGQTDRQTTPTVFNGKTQR